MQFTVIIYFIEGEVEEKGMSISKKSFVCRRGDLRIVGVAYFPENFAESSRYSAVIVSHGFMGNYLGVADTCMKFAETGFVAFSFNFCGGGIIEEDGCEKSDGATTDMTLFTEVGDLIAVKEYVQSLEYVDRERLMLMGYSMGGFVSGLVAAKCGDEIQKLIMVYPALCIPDDAARGWLCGTDYSLEHVPEVIDCGKTKLGRRFHEAAMGVNPYLKLSAYKGPVLVLQGLADPLVNYSYAIRAKESYKKGQCHLQLIRDMGHRLEGHQLDSAFESIMQFIKERKETLTVRVIITHVDSSEQGDKRKSDIYFTGYCETPYFKGTVLPEGCDAREWYREKEIKVRAEYTLVGIDSDGKSCSVHIVNQMCEGEWKPSVQTDSKALRCINTADLTAVLEYAEGGPTVRIFADNKFM